MDYRKLIKHIKSKHWYRQGAAVKPLYISYPYEACSHFTVREKLIAPYYYGYVGFFKLDYMYYYFTSESAKSVCDYYIDRQKKSKNFIQNLKKRWEQLYFFPIWKECEQINNADFQNLSNHALQKLFAQFSSKYEKAWRESIFLDAFDIHSESIANQIAQKYGNSLKQEQIQTLTSGKERSWVQKESLDLIKLLSVKKGLKQKLIEHSKKWHWMHNDYADIRNLSARFFKAKLNKLKKHQNLLLAEKAALKLLDKNFQARKVLLKTKNLKKDDLSIFDGLSSLAVWRDFRKAMNQMVSYTVKRFINEISARTLIPLINLEELFYWEITGAFKDKLKTTRLIEARKNGILLSDFPNPYTPSPKLLASSIHTHELPYQ